MEKIIKNIKLSGYALLNYLKSNNYISTGTENVLLESLKFGRYSYLAINPYLVFKSKGENIWINGFLKMGNPFTELQNLLKLEKKRLKIKKDWPGIFNSGCVGYLGYDLAKFLEKIPEIAIDDLKLPDSYLIFPNEIVIIDHEMSLCQIVIIDSDGVKMNKLLSAIDKIKSISNEIILERDGIKLSNTTLSKMNSGIKHNSVINYKVINNIKSNLTFSEYSDAVRRAKEKIFSGNSFQIKLCQRLEFKVTNSLQLYGNLRLINPSPYMAYMDLGEIKLVSASPERLLKLEGRNLLTSPIAGTYPRCNNMVEEEKLKQKFLSDSKELAEHTMLIDLERNDLGKVSTYGTVKVAKLMEVQKYSHLMHFVTNISSKLHRSKNYMHAIKAMFPGGTITGCPKVETMKIIEDLETVTRGPYSGCMGFINLNYDLDLSIIIRTMIVRQKKGYLYVGGGIVADSNAEREFQETIEKGMALIEALK